MRMKRTTMEFTKTIEVVVYAPESTTTCELGELASNLAYDGLTDWDDPAWEAYVAPTVEVDVPDEECIMETRRARFGGGNVRLPPRGTTFARDEVLVVSDDRDDIVSPVDATWWQVESPAVRSGEES